ncbi:MAG: dnaN [Parachlamydiales bacterium]|nr:dnaN [Parachlamydiales bacterium]
MKAVIAKNDLVSLIGKIQNVVSSKPSIPILANILIEALDDQIVVSGTDLTVSMRCFMDATVIEEGSIALPARRFFQLVRELTSPQVKIATHLNEIAEITTGTSVFKVNGMNKAEFPALPDLKGSPEATFTGANLREMLSKTAFAAAREDSRYMLNGVQLQISAQQATFIGTDGKRLARASSPVLVDAPVRGAYVIPLKAVEEMIKMLENGDAKAVVSLSADKIALECGQLSLITKLLSGQFPDVERVIPSNLAHQFSIHREELMSLLRQVSLFTSENSNSVRFTFETGQLHLSATSSEIGEGRVSMPVDFSGSRLEIAFNPFFLLDILRHSKDETVRIGLNDAHNPGLITDSTQAQFVLMPMRLSEISTGAPEEAVTVQ